MLTYALIRNVFNYVPGTRYCITVLGEGVSIQRPDKNSWVVSRVEDNGREHHTREVVRTPQGFEVRTLQGVVTDETRDFPAAFSSALPR